MSNTKCKYCGNGCYGSATDGRHPNKVHVHNPDGKHCVYCGGTCRGSATDGRHPNKVHEI